MQKQGIAGQVSAHIFLSGLRSYFVIQKNHVIGRLRLGEINGVLRIADVGSAQKFSPVKKATVVKVDDIKSSRQIILDRKVSERIEGFFFSNTEYLQRLVRDLSFKGRNDQSRTPGFDNRKTELAAQGYTSCCVHPTGIHGQVQPRIGQFCHQSIGNKRLIVDKVSDVFKVIEFVNPNQYIFFVGDLRSAGTDQADWNFAGTTGYLKCKNRAVSDPKCIFRKGPNVILIAAYEFVEEQLHAICMIDQHPVSFQNRSAAGSPYQALAQYRQPSVVQQGITNERRIGAACHHHSATHCWHLVQYPCGHSAGVNSQARTRSTHRQRLPFGSRPNIKRLTGSIGRIKTHTGETVCCGRKKRIRHSKQTHIRLKCPGFSPHTFYACPQKISSRLPVDVHQVARNRGTCADHQAKQSIGTGRYRV